MSLLLRFRSATRAKSFRQLPHVSPALAFPCRKFSGSAISDLLGARQNFVIRHHEGIRKGATYLGHFAFVVATATYSFQDIVSIRIGAIASSSLVIAFQMCYPAPQYLTVFWQYIYIGINSWQLKRTFGETVPPLTWEEAKLHSLFSHRFLTESEIQPILALGQWHWLMHDARLIEESSSAAPDMIFMITSGECEASLAGNKLANFGPGSIVGEVTFVSENALAMTVKAKGPVRCLAIPVAALGELLHGKPDLQAKVEQLFLNSLAGTSKQIYAEVQQQRYRAVMQVAAHVGCKAADAVATFRSTHAVPEDVHTKLLRDEVPVSLQEEFEKENLRVQVMEVKEEEKRQQQRQQQHLKQQLDPTPWAQFVAAQLNINLPPMLVGNST